MQHITLYQEPGRYAGWPANYGIWSWGNEIVVGFTLGHYQEGVAFHPRDKNRPFVAMQARSLDGGESWTVEPFPGSIPGGRGLSADEHVHRPLQVGPVLDSPDGPQPCPGDVDFTHPDFALMVARSGLGPGTRSWFYLSTDRCRSWQDPYALPLFGQPGVAGRTDYLVDGPQTCTFFLTAAKAQGGEGRVFCARTQDGGRTMEFVAWVTPDVPGYAIMPASVRLDGGEILTAVRCSDAHDGIPATRCWIDLYTSTDNGHSWSLCSTPVPNNGRGGNPPTLTQLRGGRLCLTYGFRDAPYGIRSQLSSDNGKSWGDPILLRTDGGNHDLGYPRTVQRADGQLVTVYYFNHQVDGERSIEATIWPAKRSA